MKKSYIIRRIKIGEWFELKELRLRALQTDRIPFGSTFEETNQRPDSFWRSLAENGASGSEHAVFIALASQMMGMIRADRIDSDSFGIYSMWVTPENRKQGVAQDLLSEAEDWIKSVGAKKAKLFVADKAPAALSLYQKCGYLVDGRTDESPHAGVTELGMTKLL